MENKAQRLLMLCSFSNMQCRAEIQSKGDKISHINAKTKHKLLFVSGINLAL